MDFRVCLVIVFNHRYDKNIKRLREIYSGKFSNIMFLVPFYDGADKDVCPVYESSFQFQGYLIQAFGKLSKMDVDYYMFIGDDLILNPQINESNFVDYFALQEKEVYCHKLRRLSDVGLEWSHSRYSSGPFFNRATEWRGSLPSYDIAKEKYESFFGCTCAEEYTEEFFWRGVTNETEEERKNIVHNFIKQNGNSKKIPYPLAMGYSDIFIIKKDKLFDISRIMGIFSAMNLFVEIAIPTAIVLTTDRTKVSMLSDTRYSAILFWEKSIKEEFETKYNNNLVKLREEWPENELYIHPIKLSQWSE